MRNWRLLQSKQTVHGKQSKPPPGKCPRCLRRVRQHRTGAARNGSLHGTRKSMKEGVAVTCTVVLSRVMERMEAATVDFEQRRAARCGAAWVLGYRSAQRIDSWELVASVPTRNRVAAITSCRGSVCRPRPV